MQITSSFCRYEKKYVISQQQSEELLLRLGDRIHADAYSMGQATYRICNVYFDTDNSDVIRYSLSSPFYKEKLRLRTYGTPENYNAVAFLELKKKVNGLVLKRRATLTLGQAYDFLRTRNRPSGLGYIDEQVLDEIEYYLDTNDVHPAVYIGYDRAAYYSKDDPTLRITFDRNITTRRERNVRGETSACRCEAHGDKDLILNASVACTSPYGNETFPQELFQIRQGICRRNK